MKRRHQPSMGELNAFECAARHGNFTRAGKELDLAQSAVSRQVRNLETKLGVALFERVRQRAVLTTAGSLYLSEVRAILTCVNDASQRIMSLAGFSEVINLAVLPTFATRWLLPKLGEFSDAHPSLTINMEARLTMFDFAETSFDAAIHYGSPSWPGAHSHHLFNEEMVPVANPSYRDKHGLRVPSDLGRATLLHQSTRPNAWQEWFFSCETTLDPMVRGSWFEQFAMVAQAASSGLGVALLPRILIEEELQAGRLVILFQHFLRTTSAYYIVVPDGKGPSTEIFTKWIIRTAKSLLNHESA